MKQNFNNADEYAKNVGFIHELREDMLQLLNPEAGEKIMDLGCGDGKLSQGIAEYRCEVIGIDSSQSMVDATRAKGIKAYVMDGHCINYISEFDAAFSNGALHWMLNPDEVIKRVYLALKKKGRFVGEFGGQGNVEQVRQAIHIALDRRDIDFRQVDPWYFPSIEDYKARLEKANFKVSSIKLFKRPIQCDIEDWLSAFANPFFINIPQAERMEIYNEIKIDLAKKIKNENGQWIIDYVRLQFLAVKE